jgi:hypothetical protein
LFLPVFISAVFVSRGTDTPASQTKSARAWEVENVVVQASVQEDTEGLIRKVTLLAGELAEAR